MECNGNDRKIKGDTDLAAKAKADIRCSAIHRNATIMERLKDGMLENINILKKLRDNWMTEGKISGIQAESSAGVQVMSGNAPWRARNGA